MWTLYLREQVSAAARESGCRLVGEWRGEEQKGGGWLLIYPFMYLQARLSYPGS